ncbi:flagellar biosynthetic protein FliO [Consotaella aegiceratis]|uniref:flagellar biosynthetic protein FliO n=1 Tax=Consotaella aegiceratis TaxID=3097961 RepID=UPI002F4286BD
MAQIVWTFMAAAIVIGLALVSVWIIRKFFTGSLRAGAKGKQPRLGIVDAVNIDPKRKLVLIRRDDVEHLLLVGGQNDMLVEPGIARTGKTAKRQPPLFSEPWPDLAESSADDVATGAPPQAAPRPARLKPEAPVPATRRPEPKTQPPQVTAAAAVVTEPSVAPLPTILPAETPTAPVEWPVFSAPEEAEERDPDDADASHADAPLPSVQPVVPDERVAAPAARQEPSSAPASPRLSAPRQPAAPAPSFLRSRSVEGSDQAPAEPVRPAAPPRPVTTPTWPQQPVTAPARQAEQPAISAGDRSGRVGASATPAPVSQPSAVAASPQAGEPRRDAARVSAEPTAPTEEQREPFVPSIKPEDSLLDGADTVGRGPLSVRSFVTNVQQSRSREGSPAPAVEPRPLDLRPSRPTFPPRREPRIEPELPQPPRPQQSAAQESPVPAADSPMPARPPQPDVQPRPSLARLFTEDADDPISPSRTAAGASSPLQQPSSQEPEPAAFTDGETKGTASRPKTLEEEMEALLGDFSLDAPERR